MRLYIHLTDHITGRFESAAEELKRDYFILNISFVLDEIMADSTSCNFTVEKYTDQNYQLVRIPNLKKAEHIEILYHGTLDGTTGLYPYARETTCGDFVLLRQESLYFPLFTGKPDETDAFLNYCQMTFDLTLELNPPRTAFSNLELISKTESRYHFHGNLPTIVIGSFQTTTIPGGTFVFRSCDFVPLKEISALIHSVFAYMNDTYGRAELDNILLAAIPDGYGSFVIRKTLFLALENFHDERNLIHELIHLEWNPNCESIPPVIQRCRFFDEGLTQYLMGEVYEFLHPGSLSETYRIFRETFRLRVKEWAIPIVPLVLYGKYDAGDLAYGYGPFVLKEIETQIGKQNLTCILCHFLSDHQNSPADFEEFFRLLKPFHVEALLDRLFYQTEYQQALLD